MKNLIIALMLCISLPIYGLPMQKRAQQYAEEVRFDVENGRLADRTNKALDNMLAVAYRELKERGYDQYAEEMRIEWLGQWYGYLNRRDVGDHPQVFCEWLDKVYAKLEAVLGKEVLEFFHLDDIWVVNRSIPVALHCIISFDLNDYTQHMNGLLGSISYWSAEISCLILSSGILAFFCSPLGMLAEHIMITSFSPFIAKRVYERFCSEDQVVYISSPSTLWNE